MPNDIEPRIAMATREGLDEPGQAVWDQVGATRNGVIGGPFRVWMHIPDLAAAADVFGSTLRVYGVLPKHLFELVTLVCARHWEAPYPWSAHVDIAMDAGLSDASLVAVREQLAADTVEDEEERLVLILVRSLLETGTIGDAEFAEGVRRYGEQGMIELVTSVGFYSTAAFVANTFQVPVTAQPRHGGLR